MKESSKQPPIKKSKTKNKVLGPVINLEEHVSPEWWKSIFNFNYLKTDADIVEDNSITQQEVDQFIDILKLNPSDSILDLCCGQGRHSMEIARRGYKNIKGIDRSHYLIQKAKERSKKEGLDIKFREGDARKLPYLSDSFDVVMILGNSFGYFETLEDDLRVLKEVHRVLKPWGRVLIDVANGEFLKQNFQARSWEWIDKKYFVCRERSLSLDTNKLISRELVSHIDKGVIADQFYAVRLYNQEKSTELLKKAGFSDISVMGEIATNSARNQDLGMMQQRLIMKCIVRKEWTPITKKKQIEKNVVVILGDPSKPDNLKPSSIFDDDDFYTIDQLKDALKKLNGYQFTYISNHDLLINDLNKIKQKIKIDYVFNLCDEGFNNDPRKELHVPSILEVLGVPYTGSGPQALAYCYDKSLVRGIAKEMGIPVSEAFFVKPEDSTFDLSFPFPVIVKPNSGDSSFGITQKSVANNIEELTYAISGIREKFGYEKPILVEEFLTGKDISVGIIGNPPESYKVLPIIEEDYSSLPPDLPKICGYEAKWQPESPYFSITSIPADLPADTERMVIESCLKLYERLEVRDYSRFDWRLDAQGNPKLLEVNPNPGWCWDGHLARMAKFAGINYPEMITAILEATEQRLGIGSPQN
ncbi:MAG: methyltransferase domain-containing protein [Candidatus Margulisbacteria bacterium]|nr:methyltransferase domain-containing protein [Candidatus Margulisiibacteriota bacterium]